MLALGFTSCAYDPYYSPTSVSGSYSSGYGPGYGYGGSSFSTSIFVATGDPRWGYDPGCYSYYDYRRRCYYDPYLNGYYPVGYRPPVVYGVPHPYGWRPGSGYCPPPRRVTNVTVVNYRNRESAYRNSDYNWARQVRQQPAYGGSYQMQRPAQGGYDSQNYTPRPNTYTRPYDSSSQWGGQPYPAPQRNSWSRDSGSGTRQENSARPPAHYNTPVSGTSSAPAERQYPRQQAESAPRPLAQPDEVRSNPRQSQSFLRGGNRTQAQPDAPRNDDNRGLSFLRGNHKGKPKAPEEQAPAPPPL